MDNSKTSAGREWFISWMSQNRAITFESRHYELYGADLPSKTWDSFGRTPNGYRKRKFYEDVAIADKLNESNRCECVLTVWPFSLPYNDEIQGRECYIGTSGFVRFLKPWSQSLHRWNKIRCPKTNDGESKFCHNCRYGLDSHIVCWIETYRDLLPV
jgi:hypothetical protein